MADHEHYFTGHTNARLTFVIGIVLGISIVTTVGLAFFMYLFNGGTVASYAIAPLDTTTQILDEPIQEITTSDQSIVVDESTHIYGAQENYAVTLVQYVDYECRFCKKFFPDLLTFVDQYPDKVRFIVKHYPLVQIHPAAKTAAIAAECAGEQGKFIEYSSRLYAGQNDLDKAETYTTIAETLQLDSVAFTDCRDRKEVVSTIEEDVAEALSLQIQSQPNLLIWHNDNRLELIDGYVNTSYIAGSLQAELDSE